MLSQFFSPISGGEERVVEDLAAGLAARGHEVAVATLSGAGLPRLEQRSGFRVHRLDGLAARFGSIYKERSRPHLAPAPDPMVVAGLRRVLAEEKPDVVHAHNWIVHSFLPLKRRAGVPLVLSLHDYSLLCANKRLMRFGVPCSGPAAAKCLRCSADYYGAAKGTVVSGLLQLTAPMLLARADMYLPVSRAVAEALELERRRLPFEVIPNLIPESAGDERPADPQQLELLPKGDFVLFLGDASTDKGALLLLRAHAMLEGAPPLVFIGRPIDVGAEAKRLPNVHVLGTWPHELAMEAVNRCAVLAVPSLVPETFGMVALEAMSRGRPVVAAEIGGLGELVVDRVTGLLVPPGDASALRHALAELLADPGLRQTMGEAGRARAGSYSATTIVPRFEHVYDSLLRSDAASTGVPNR